MSPANLESVSNNWHDAVGTYKDAQADARTSFYTKKALLSLAINVSKQNATDDLDEELKNPTQTKSYNELIVNTGYEFDVTPGRVLSKILPKYFKTLYPQMDAQELKRNLDITYYYLDTQGNIDELYVGEIVRFPGDATMHIVGKDGNERKVFNLRPKPEGGHEKPKRDEEHHEEEDADEPVAIPPAKRREVEPPARKKEKRDEPPAPPTQANDGSFTIPIGGSEAAPTPPPAPASQEPAAPPPAEEPASAPPARGKIDLDSEY